MNNDFDFSKTVLRFLEWVLDKACRHDFYGVGPVQSFHLPSQSPGLNPIQHICNEHDIRQYPFASKENLTATIQRAWSEIGLQSMIDAKGGPSR